MSEKENSTGEKKKLKKPLGKKEKRLILIASIVVVIVLLALIPSAKKKGFGKKGNEVESVHTVMTMVVAMQNLQEYLTLNGNIQANDTVSVFPQINGKIAKTYTNLGDSIKKGSVIALVDPSIPGSSYALSPVMAPISGTVTSYPLAIGTSVTTSSSIAKIGNIGDLQIKTHVSERDVGVIQNGLKAEITLIAYPDVTFGARVIRVSPIVDETSRTKEVYMVFEDRDDRINAGMYARIKLNTKLHPDVIAIPFQSVSSVDSKYYVFVVKEDNTVEKREVNIGINVDGIVEIVSGLKDGEVIVSKGIQVLEDGSKIKNIGSVDETQGSSPSEENEKSIEQAGSENLAAENTSVVNEEKTAQNAAVEENPSVPAEVQSEAATEAKSAAPAEAQGTAVEGNTPEGA